ncbi:MAG: leucyl aminopeptidase, partial [Pseudomonadota bacterium]|nr:leucyl aminopeptidase [Pseudomonadota bacterium]
MKIEFADARPTGDYALVLPSADGNRPGAASLSDLDKIEATLRRQRFEGEAGSAAEAFTDDGGTARRVLFVGIGSNSAGEAAEKLGGTAVSRLLKSGEKHAVIDVTGMGFDADAAARIALAASLRSWRYDRYHTKTKDKQKPTLET